MNYASIFSIIGVVLYLLVSTVVELSEASNVDCEWLMTCGQGNLAPFLTVALQDGDLADFFNAAFRAAISVGGILAVLRIAYAGFIYMTTDLPGAKGGAKEMLQQTLMGLLLLLAVWLILNQINPQILNLEVLETARQNPAPGAPQMQVGQEPRGDN